VRFDKDLNETVVMNINDAIEPALEDEYSYLWVNSYVLDKSGNVVFKSKNSIYGINLSSKELIFNFKPEDENSYIQGIYPLPDGGAGVQLYSYEQTDDGFTNSNTIAPIDAAAGKLGDPIPFAAQYNLVKGTDGFDYYYSDQMGVYGYDLETAEKTVVVDLLASGIADMGFNTIMPVSATEFAAAGFDNANGQSCIYMLSKVDPADLPEKQLVTVAALFQDYSLTQYIMSYNKLNTVYQVEIKSYNSDPNVTYDQMITNFNNDIISGNIPDVILVDGNMPYDSFAAKGLLMDLTKRFDADEDISLDDLVTPVVDALKTADGNLFSIAPCFTIQTFVGKTSVFGEKQGQSMAELQAAADKVDGASLFSPYTVRSDFMDQYVYRMIGNYIDKDTGECHFDTPEFISLLNMVKQFPEEINYETYDYMSEQLAYKEDRTLIENAYINDFRALVRYEKGSFDAPITFLGYPNSDGKSGVVAQFNIELAIMDKAKNPDGAWDFVKGMLSYHDANTTSPSEMYGQFPIFQADLETFAQAAKERMYYIDFTTKEKVYYDNTAWIGDTEIKLPDNTDADNAKVMALINSISSVNRSETELQKIIEDDMKTFYSGQKSAEETASIIQNRASTYIAESR
jgi:ABC-type glycerol-3-phosphate transport system substrate-binding protein